MKIPDKQIQIAGKNIDIVIDSKYCQAEKCYGRAEYDRNRIIIEDSTVSGVHPEKIEQAFLHECIHMINAILRRESPYDDEEYVGPSSELWYQIIKQLKNKRNK
jgi:hypothetical protein